ncbi:hypothetical protein [Fibrobacter intestinalis]|uniref:hypothetical protein n=1 Tax=Fibrobacter intestinalis TaxID=28122 RepID=UPI0023F3A508|nr:hypothetical protein [Fibrobacter intestinalis]MDD7299244.1 hypothetical protein [Fibrobacter intestinalis]
MTKLGESRVLLYAYSAKSMLPGFHNNHLFYGVQGKKPDMEQFSTGGKSDLEQPTFIKPRKNRKLLMSWQSAGNICTAGTKITASGGTVRCKNQW